MVALPFVSPRTQPLQVSPPIALPQRAPGDGPTMPPLAADTNPAQPTVQAAYPSNEIQPPTQPEQHEQATDDDADDEDTAAYSPLLKDHVFALYCAGQRSPAIAAHLGIPERTIRHWIRTTLQQLAQDDVTASPEVARQQRALAIESQRAASASAWDTYYRLTGAYNQLLDLALMATIRQSGTTETAPQPDAAAVIADPQRMLATAGRLASAAARYLSLVINANREIAHLQGHAIAQDARERQATAAREAADARQLEADLIRAFTTPILPPEPTPLRASPAASWPGGITTPSQPRLPAHIGAATLHTPQLGPTAKTATSLGTAQAVSQSEKAAKTATLTTPTTATPVVPPLPAPGAAARATPGARSDPQGAEQPQSAARGQGERSATPTPHAVSKSPQPRRPASAKRKPQLILPSHQRLAAHPAT